MIKLSLRNQAQIIKFQKSLKLPAFDRDDSVNHAV